jgi:non-ribosomal peptide synthase protein (TIGR01720 family)
VLEADWGSSEKSLKAVKEQLRAVPTKGVGYGVWRYLRGGEGRIGAQAQGAVGEVSFNYHGQLDAALGAGGPFAAAPESAGEGKDVGGGRPHKLAVVCSVRGGELVAAWKYSRNLHRRETIEEVAKYFVDALKELIEHCRAADDGSFTPSDFPMLNLKQQQLDRIMSKVGKARLS